MMKKMMLMMVVAFCGAVIATADAGDKQGPVLKPLDDWTFFQIGFLPGFPQGTNYSNVYGIKLGAPMVSGTGSRVYGIEPSLLFSGSDYVYGIQAGWFGATKAKQVWGLQANCMVNVADEVIGFEPGLVNVTKEITGFQASAVNVSRKVTGFQASAVNVASEELKGVQLGVVNYSKKGGCQFGLVNVIEDGFLPFMIIFNFKF